MPVIEQVQAAVAEGVAGSAQHVEHITSVGPWALRRDSSSSWTAISCPGGRTRPGTVGSAIGNSSARMDASSSNPFSDAFAANLNDDNQFRERNISEASSSTAVTSSTDAAAVHTNEKSEFARTIEEVDRQAEEVRQMVDGEPITVIDGMERAISEAAMERRASRSGSSGPQTGEHVPAPAPAQQPQPPVRVLTRDGPIRYVEREAAGALHRFERDTMGCYTCQKHAQVAAVGIWLFVATILCVVASMIIFLTMDGKFDTKLFQGLLGFPFAALWSGLSLALLVLLAMGSPAHFTWTGRQFFLWWLCSLCIALLIYYLIVGLAFKFGRS